jgi:serine/threonine protein kinase/Flp pilus assembly protein TadD
MNTPTHQREEALYQQAMERTSPEEREAFLVNACAGDEALLGKLRDLLACDAEAANEEFLPTVVTGADRRTVPARVESERPGAIVGPYKLREQIGEGGFGTVWVADQEQPVRRRVALKIIKLGMDTKEVIARFEQERQALALMDHPNIAKVLDAGTTENGRPYFVMELVRGVKITEFCDDQQLPMAQRLALFITVCQAIQHAHQKGIIHRDLKPSNILVSLNDGKAVPKVIDFGIAKATQGRLTDATVYTQFEQMIGTPLYMSPEQAQMTSLDIDTRSDIYALGVLLYELVTGRTPIDTATMARAGMDEIRRLIREVDPPRPSARVKTLGGEERTTMAKRRKVEPAKLTSSLSGDLDWIVMKCLEKDRARRYDTANGLALDLQRHLANEVVTARPPTTAYLLGKLIRRHRLAFAAGTAVATSLVLGIAAATWMYFRERDARQQTAAERDAKELARQDSENISQFLGAVFRSPDPSRDGREIKVVELLDSAAKKLETGLATQPSQRAQLQFTLGRTYLGLGLAQEAIPLFERARDYHLATSGPEHPDTLGAMPNLAGSYHLAGRRDEALKLQEEVLALSRKVLGPEHPDTLKAFHNLASFYYDGGRRDEALKMLEEVLALFRKGLGPEHPDPLMVMHGLALAYSNAGRHDEALKMYEEVLALYRKGLGPGHPNTLAARNNLAVSYYNAGRLEEALKMQEEALPLCRKGLGPEHPDTLVAMANLANSYSDAGRLPEALKLQEEVLPLCRKVLGPEHPETLGAMSNLAGSYHKSGRLPEAVKLQEESLALKRRVLPPNHPYFPVALHNMTEFYEGTNRKEEAAKLRAELEALQGGVKNTEEPPPPVPSGSAIPAPTPPAEAGHHLKSLEADLESVRQAKGPEHADTIAAMTKLASAYGADGSGRKALKLGEEALALARRVLPAGDPQITAAMNALIPLYRLVDLEEEAEQLEAELTTLHPNP